MENHLPRAGRHGVQRENNNVGWNRIEWNGAQKQYHISKNGLLEDSNRAFT